MKGFGIALNWIATLMAVFGIFLLSASASGQSDDWGKSADLIEAERQLDFCMRIATDCSASRDQVNRLRSYQAPTTNASPLWGYSLAGAAPFFFILGTILFAAGKVEEIILAGRAPATDG